MATKKLADFFKLHGETLGLTDGDKEIIRKVKDVIESQRGSKGNRQILKTMPQGENNRARRREYFQRLADVVFGAYSNRLNMEMVNKINLFNNKLELLTNDSLRDYMRLLRATKIRQTQGLTNRNVDANAYVVHEKLIYYEHKLEEDILELEHAIESIKNKEPNKAKRYASVLVDKKRRLQIIHYYTGRFTSNLMSNRVKVRELGHNVEKYVGLSQPVQQLIKARIATLPNADKRRFQRKLRARSSAQ